MPPAAVNDSGRAVMARLAEFRDDTSGLLATAGGPISYTLTTNQGLAATPIDGQLIAFSMNISNGANATLAADGGGAFPLLSTPGTPLPSASLLQGSPYFATFSAGAGAWIMFSQYQTAFSIPVGGMMPYIGLTVPNSSFAFPAGQRISRTTYSALNAMLSPGYPFGPGNGSTDFNIPDLRGRSPFGLDNMGGFGATNLITVAGGNFDGTVMGNTGGAQNHTLSTPEMPAHNHTDSGHTHSFSYGNNGVGPLSLGSAGGIAASGLGIPSSSATTLSGFAAIQNTGGGGAHTILNPAIMVPFILRII